MSLDFRHFKLMSAPPPENGHWTDIPGGPFCAKMYGPAALCKMDFRERRT